MEEGWHLTERELPFTSNKRRIKIMKGDGTVEVTKGYYQATSGLNYWYLLGGNTQVFPFSWQDSKLLNTVDKKWRLNNEKTNFVD